MAEYSGFFNCSEGMEDRVYDADDFANFFRRFLQNGIFAESFTSLQVVQKSGRTVTVKKGAALIDGYWYILDADMDVTINSNTGKSNRLTTVVCNLNKTNRVVKIVTLDSPSNSGLPRNDGVNKDLVLCKITCKPSFSSISGTDIEDTRTNETYCGWVTSILKTTDLDALYTDIKNSFNEWFNVIKGQISQDEAVLINQKIGNLNSLETTDKSSAVAAINEIYSSRNVKQFDVQSKNDVVASSLKIFTLTHLNSKFGVTGAGQMRYAVTAINGNGNLSDVHVQGATWMGENLFIVFDRVPNTKVELFVRIELLGVNETSGIIVNN